jgi:hypothetical protein
MQFMMLNLKKLFSEAERKSEIENFVHFEKHQFFGNMTSPWYFVLFELKEKFIEAKKKIFVIISSNSIK